MNKVDDLPSVFYWKFKSNIVDLDDEDFIYNFKKCYGTYKECFDWSKWKNGQYSSEYNHALDWLWNNDYIYVLPEVTFDNFIREDCYNYETEKYELTRYDYDWLMRLM